MDLFSKGVYIQYRGTELQSVKAGPFSGVSASIPMPTRPRESSAPRANHGETPLEPCSHPRPWGMKGTGEIPRNPRGPPRRIPCEYFVNKT
eukprot:scaffold754_cov289-Pavlova_lutheri.AAC.5